MEYTNPEKLKEKIGEQDPPVKPKLERSKRWPDRRKNRTKEEKRIDSVSDIPYATLKEGYDQTNLIDLAESTLNNNGELSGEEYKRLYDIFKQKREAYINGDKKTRALLIKDLNDKSAAVKSFKKFREDFAAGIMTGKLQNGWLDTEEGQNYINLLGNQAQLVEKKCDDDLNCPDKNKLGVIIKDIEGTRRGEERIDKIDKELADLRKKDKSSPGNQKYGSSYGGQQHSTPAFVEIEKLEIEKEQLIQMIERGGGYMTSWLDPTNLNKRIKNVDETARKIIIEMGNSSIDRSTRAVNVENQTFNEKAAKHQIRTNLIGKSSNFESLIYDEMIPGRIMYDDLIERTMAGTYADLGLENIEGVNAKDGINEDEAKLIIDEMIKNPEYSNVLKEEMVGYFTNYLKNQWEIGKKNRPNPIKKHTYSDSEMMADVISKTTPQQYEPGSITSA